MVESLYSISGIMILLGILSLFIPKRLSFWSKKENPSRMFAFFVYIIIAYAIIGIHGYQEQPLTSEEKTKKTQDIQQKKAREEKEISSISSFINNLEDIEHSQINIFEYNNNRIMFNMDCGYSAGPVELENMCKTAIRNTLSFLKKSNINMDRDIYCYPSFIREGETGKMVKFEYNYYLKYKWSDDHIHKIRTNN